MYFALKTDMSKAYDRVDWKFLQALLHKLGFAAHWIRLVMTCVTSVSYSLIINGVPNDYFVPSCGLR